ncbi:MAG: phosphoribosylformylglycinamidine synthase subunit PurQ [Desulfovibrionales bacterium]
MGQVRALVITGYGTNCERETGFAVKKAGADETVIAHFADLVAERIKLSDFNFLLFPGGFLDADDLGAAQAAALRWKYTLTGSGNPLERQLWNFFESGGLILGICNGFQLLVKFGLLPAIDGQYFQRQCSLSYNDSARFEDRWVHLKANPASPCVFTRGIDRLYLPVRHGEGKLIPMNVATLAAMVRHNLVALQYIDPETGDPSQEYPFNPNGSPLAIAALTDPSGRIMGLMPHPEAYNHPTNHPSWTRGAGDQLGLVLMENGVRYLKEQG